ncbi:MAG: nickel-responsive transcriptional regulator NikR [Lentisphaeria bacterium]|nr:nickel-responsive transcriptional regulator NikR [Lentisphaeria bacterium]
MSNITRVSLSLEAPLLEKLDRMAERQDYRNRSEFIRDLVRAQIARKEWETGGEVIGTLTVIYNHHQRGLTEKLVELQHHCHETVLASTHVHLSHEICAEMIMLRGQGSGINELANAIRRQRGVLHAELAMSTTGEKIL